MLIVLAKWNHSRSHSLVGCVDWNSSVIVSLVYGSCVALSCRVRGLKSIKQNLTNATSNVALSCRVRGLKYVNGPGVLVDRTVALSCRVRGLKLPLPIRKTGKISSHSFAGCVDKNCSQAFWPLKQNVDGSLKMYENGNLKLYNYGKINWHILIN